MVASMSAVVALVAMIAAGAPSDPCSPGLVAGDPGCEGTLNRAVALGLVGGGAVVALACFWLASVLRRQWRRAVRFNPPPGWPNPQPEWAPFRGWQPDPAWPEPPEDWRFWVETPHR